MFGILRGSCKHCQLLQTRFPSQGLRNVFVYSKQAYRTASSSIQKLKYDEQNTKKEGKFFKTLVEDHERVWHSIEHDVTDEDMFSVVKDGYLQKLQELKEEEEIENKKNNEKIKKRKNKKRQYPKTSQYAKNNQLTYQGELNILAEIDIYVYLGEISKAYGLFNFHRRHGHQFGVDAYNKMIHAWAEHSGWKNVNMLLQSMKRQGIYPTHQTYAGLLQLCGKLNDKKKVDKVLTDMMFQGLDINEIFKKSILSKQQISSIVNALSLVHPQYQEEFEAHNKPSTYSPLDEKTLKKINRQMDIELNGYEKVISINKQKLDNQVLLKRAALYQNLISEWKKKFVEELMKANQNKEKNSSIYNRCVGYTKVLPPELLADILFDQIVPIICSQPNGIPVSFICRRLGYLIYQGFSSKYRQEKGVPEKVRRIAEQYTCFDFIVSDVHSREKWQEINDSLQYLCSQDVYPAMWPTKLRTMASSVLLDILKKVAVVDTSIFYKSKYSRIEPCVSHELETTGHNSIGIIKFHPTVSKLYAAYLSQAGDLVFEANKLPMLIPPRPWLSPTSGAYMLLHTDLVRTITGQYKLNQLIAANDGGNLNKIYDSLNYLGNCKWKVNHRILDIMIDLFNGKGDLSLDIIGPDLPYLEERKAKKAMTYEEKLSRQRQKKLFHELFALRMDLLYKLSIANHYRNDEFWTPSNLDFRGRVYPIAPHCSHIGSDVSRGMMLFADGKKLGKNGLDWLKVHLVNVHGQLKKSSLKERIDYAEENIDNIMDSADNPLNGRCWWKGGSDPWQTLAACMEITDAIRSSDPENFVSHLAVHQDGSCNGLQHYAALGRDSYGARQVNLTRADRPQDVYSEVAMLVDERRKKDAASGVKIAQQLDGKVTRKVVKQTVMTVVYGVTFVGGRLQIEKQLKELNVPDEIMFKASVYVVKEVFKSLAQMFTSARLLQDWLTVAAAKIALTGNCVDWVTPLGLPVIQPYHRETQNGIATPLQFVSSKSTYDHTQVPHLTKQKGGFPPNFVHSLDSSHMMLTSLQCEKANMTFASVHDSFWTHACDIDKLNKFTREEFVRLHELPILHDLKKHFDDKYTGLRLRNPLKGGTTHAAFADLPESGGLDIKEVLDSPYFFS